MCDDVSDVTKLCPLFETKLFGYERRSQDCTYIFTLHIGPQTPRSTKETDACVQLTTAYMTSRVRQCVPRVGSETINYRIEYGCHVFFAQRSLGVLCVVKLERVSDRENTVGN